MMAPFGLALSADMARETKAPITAAEDVTTPAGNFGLYPRAGWSGDIVRFSASANLCHSPDKASIASQRHSRAFAIEIVDDVLPAERCAGTDDMWRRIVDTICGLLPFDRPLMMPPRDSGRGMTLRSTWQDLPRQLWCDLLSPIADGAPAAHGWASARHEPPPIGR